MMYSLAIFMHFALIHIASVLVTDVSEANFKLFLQAFGIDLLTEVAVLFVVIFWSFFLWVLFSMAAVIGETAHWSIWVIAYSGTLVPFILIFLFTGKLLLGSPVVPL